MFKAQVENELLGRYVLMPDSEVSSFKTWWRSFPESTMVSVRLPHVEHGNAGKPSNSANKAVLEAFLAFVDANCEAFRRSNSLLCVEIFHSSSSQTWLLSLPRASKEVRSW
jgi:hypothetical protein